MFSALKMNIIYNFSSKKPRTQPGGEIPNDPSNMPKWMQEQMEYVQQMQQYMQQCHQFAQVCYFFSLFWIQVKVTFWVVCMIA